MRWRIAVPAALALACGLLACHRTPPPQHPPVPTPTPAPTPPPTPPPPFVPNKRLETGRIFNGMQYRVTLETEVGTTATADRNDPASYAAELHVKVRVPKPHKNLAEITRLNADLPKLLPGLAPLIESAKVSRFFEDLYRLKVANLQSSLSRLDNLLTRHNFFDTETVLELEDAKTKRRALFVQSDMDVDEDGSDSDRVPEVDGSSVTFQPFTSYKWAKKTAAPNSFILPRETKLRPLELELVMPGVTPARARELKETIARLKSEISDLKKYSYLVASTDPYVVLPGSMFGKTKGPFAPAVGDFCVVAFGAALYPAIVGDVGPAYKSGEASLRICKQLNARADTNNRPINDLKVSYLIFPGTAEKSQDVPDLAKWNERCGKLLDEIGGHTSDLFVWEDLTKPKAPPVPVLPPVAPVAPSTPAPTTPVPAPVR